MAPTSVTSGSTAIRACRAGLAAAGVAWTLLLCSVPVVWGAGGAYFDSGHAHTSTGVNRVPEAYAPGECGHCHEGHASQDADTTLYRYGLFALEERVCWACHDGGTPYAADARSPFLASPGNTSIDYYKHPVSELYSGATPSTHRAGERAATAFGGTGRHAECVDCHNPHAARNDGAPGHSTHEPGAGTSNRLSGALLGAMGLIVSAWQSAGASFVNASYAPGRLESMTTNYEWELCLKCHSSFATLPTYTVGSGPFLANKITSVAAGQVSEYRDIGQAFNPSNLSYHPVTARGRNTAIPPGSFTAPWSDASTMYCSDCHDRAQAGMGASGPHGSTNVHILGRPFYLQENTHHPESSWGRNLGHDPGELCFTCHRWETYVQKQETSGADPITATNFRQQNDKNWHARHIGDEAMAGATCYTCHDVHGTNSYHLINFNTATVTPEAGYDSISAYEHTASGGACYLTCHGRRHDPKEYSR